MLIKQQSLAYDYLQQLPNKKGLTPSQTFFIFKKRNFKTTINRLSLLCIHF